MASPGAESEIDHSVEAVLQKPRLSRAEAKEIALKVIERARDFISAEDNSLVKRLKARQKKCLERRHRHLLVISGGSPEKQGVLAGYIVASIARVLRKARGEVIRVLYIYHDEFDTARVRKEVFKLFMKRWAGRKVGVDRVIDVYERSEKYLGTTFDILVLDLNDDLKPNDLGRLVEIVRGGGLIVLLTPGWDAWDTKLTIFKQKLLVPGFTEPRHIFIKWVKRTIMEAENTIAYDADRGKVIHVGKIGRPPPLPFEDRRIPEETVLPKEVYRLALTQDQVNFVKLVEENLINPPKGKKVALVITADRGRGKSCALGIALVGLARHLAEHRRRVRVVLTAPEPSNVASLFSLAIRAAEALGLQMKVLKRDGHVVELRNEKISIEYWRPLDVPRLRADIVAVDEASGIHVPQLHRIFDAHSRLIFTATIHGYEGAGRGFSIRFLGELRNRRDVVLKEYHMNTPIRYSAGDPIESWLYRALLLNAEPAELSEEDIRDVKEGRLIYQAVDPHSLFTKEGEEELRGLFGIYVLAHYRNQPDDLGLLADAPHHMIRVVKTSSGKIVSAIQIAMEGGLNEELVEALLRGYKIAGNIIPDRLLKHLRLIEIGSMVGYRIVRIATHPKVQDMGVGSFAIRKLLEEAEERGLDWIGSGFGVNSKLLRFWLKNGFTALHMSPDRNPVSGEFTLIVLLPISDKASKIAEIGTHIFKEKLLYSLRDTYKDLEIDVASMLLDLPSFCATETPSLHPVHVDRLWVYAYGPMTYEASSDVMYALAVHYFLCKQKLGMKLDTEEQELLIAKVLQGKDWQTVATELRTSENRVMQMLKEIAGKFLLYLFKKDASSGVGLTLSDLSCCGGRGVLGR